jgi:glutamate-1-semialdehyde aminotransferase
MVHFFLKRHREQVACVIMMPLEIELPEPRFLAGVKDLAHQHGALFILDEMRSGFHLALGGAQEYYGVTPDLATFSKAISNGYAISVLAGRRELMQDWFVCAAHTEQDLAGTLETSEVAFRAVKEELARGYRAPTRQEMAVTVSTGLDAANKTRICR